MTLAIDRAAIAAFLAALGVAPDEAVDWRAIHDTDKTVAAIPFRDPLERALASIERYNNGGYGIFCTVNEMDGAGRSIEHVRAIRANVIDFDGVDGTWSQYQAVSRWDIPPTFLVTAAIPGKFHAYWTFQKQAAIADLLRRYEETQRKLVTRWQSDPAVVDPTRVMRVPGTWHQKDPARPVLVTMRPGSGAIYKAGALDWALAGVQASAGGMDRRGLEDPALSAPSLEWAVKALSRIDPETCDRAEWLKLSAAFKASAWLHTNPDVVRLLWDQWCAKYAKNDPAENEKLWQSITRSATGWNYLSGAAGVRAEVMFGANPSGQIPSHIARADAAAVPSVSSKPLATMNSGSGMLDAKEQGEWFANCVFIGNQGKILVANGRLMDAQQFNGWYGGRTFLLSADGTKATDEPWKAALRGQVFNIPKVDHLRFVPSVAPGAIIRDDFGREGVNTYRPAIIDLVEGDASPWTNHVRKMVGTEQDARILFSYWAHLVQRPGVKAFWAPLIQSAEGAGKGVIGEALTYAVGAVYVHKPDAQQLIDGGTKFNAWLQSKLLIIADEIKVDEKRDMLEALKPLITETRLEIQGKGANQDMGDNFANWQMFTNHKDAIPITKDSRRYAIFYSPLQTAFDVSQAGMGGDYFPRLYAWLRDNGNRYVAWFLKNYPIEPEFDPVGAAHRAPVTSSTAEAIIQSRSRVEQAIMQAVEDERPGFRGGWLSSAAVSILLRSEDLRSNPHSLKKAFLDLGYHFIGRANRAYFQEENKQPNLYNFDQNAHVGHFGKLQNYE